MYAIEKINDIKNKIS